MLLYPILHNKKFNSEYFDVTILINVKNGDLIYATYL